MLSIQNVSKTFGALRAVDGISLDLQPGVLGLIGHNGAGKSTLMQMLATLSRPSSGRILLDGQDIVARPEVMRRRLGFLPQDFGVYPHLTALEFLQYFAALKGVRSAARIQELLALVNLHEQQHRPAAGFSGGMRQRLGIAQALLADPDVLIVDEPTAGLDPEERLRFRRLLSELGSRRLVIVSTHIVSDVENMASHLAILRQGRLVAIETPEALIRRAEGQVWSALLSANDFDALRNRVQLLHTQPQGDHMLVRMAHPQAPCAQAQSVSPSLEEALMTQRYADAHLGATA
ncbi:ABC-type multidrug transport system ATPase subunit [Inhella inkyongensis]|uniref:ABC-type multidrug transport system ATPase subunit n=1 Tax=Inhella inkyongensis TaxID=392593 RepID=A0A840RX10_9BURK|nr:ABC transporter ATP-binding protein [Inhella inkyongensis]MBB5203247.1 ABC-type multidrug transport system ATPase subunit [Inhella inkyongensis]